MFLPAITDAREHLDRRCIDHAPLSTRDVRRMSGLRYGAIRRLELSGVIPPVRRAGNRRLAWSCDEAIEMLKKIEEHKWEVSA